MLLALCLIVVIMMSMSMASGDDGIHHESSATSSMTTLENATEVKLTTGSHENLIGIYVLAWTRFPVIMCVCSCAWYGPS